MRIQCNNHLIEIKRVYKEIFDSIELYGQDYDDENEYYLTVFDHTLHLSFFDINNTDFILFKDSIIIINNLKLYIYSNKLIEKDIESYYLASYEYNAKLIIILQTSILVIKDNDIFEIYFDSITDYKINNNELKLFFEDKVQYYDINELVNEVVSSK